jgi:nitrate reductase gamma subunit
MKIFVSLVAVLALFVLAYVGTAVMGLGIVFGVVVPYIAIAVFLIGFSAKVLSWTKVPVPFRIPTTCGQQKSLPWIQPSPIENPSGKVGVVVRMFLEVFAFRSLARNTVTEVRPDGQVTHASSKWLWVASLAFHYCFLVVIIRHLRFFIDPVPECITVLASLDGLMEIGVPELYVSGAVLLAGATYLLLRRLAIPMLRYGSLPADYFPLFLIMGIACTGLLLRHVVRTDVTGAKELAMGLVTFHPVLPAGGLHWLFATHLFLVSVLLVYFPFSKLMHMGGVFLSPTRNLSNNNRAVRHVNPWDYPVKTHPYEEYEDDFREKMKGAGIAVDKE